METLVREENPVAEGELGLGIFPVTGERLSLRFALLNASRTGTPAGEVSPTSPPEAREVPEVFDLQPLSSKCVTAKVLKVEPAPFWFVAEEITPEVLED